MTNISQIVKEPKDTAQQELETLDRMNGYLKAMNDMMTVVSVVQEAAEEAGSDTINPRVVQKAIQSLAGIAEERCDDGKRSSTSIGIDERGMFSIFAVPDQSPEEGE